MQNNHISILTILSLLFGLTSYSQCNQETGLEKEGVFSKAKTVKTTGIYLKDGSNDTVNIRTSSYNRDGDNLGYLYHHKNSEFKETRMDIEFDGQGNPILELRYDVNDKLESKNIYIYDSLNNKIEDQYYTRKGTFLDSYTHYKYNENCKLINYITYYSDSTVWLTYSFTYKNGLLISVIDNYRKTVDKMEYDSFGNCIKTTGYDKDGKETSITRYEYTFDRKNNWITKTTYIDEKIYWMDERKIKYFLF